MRVYDYITQAYEKDKTERGDLARELVELAKQDKTVRNMDTFIDFTNVAERMRLSQNAFSAMTEALYCESCTACGLPIT